MALQFSRVSLLVAFLIALHARLSLAVGPPSSALVARTTAAASIYPGTSAWTYYGCYNETTSINGTNGLRALSGGVMEALDTMTVATCLSFCSSNSYSFAGLEYTRECYCAKYLSAFSAHLPDSACNLPCEGNSSQVCGGSLTLTVYQAGSSSKGAGTRDARTPFEAHGLYSVLALVIAVCGLLLA